MDLGLLKQKPLGTGLGLIKTTNKVKVAGLRLNFNGCTNTITIRSRLIFEILPGKKKRSVTTISVSHLLFSLFSSTGPGVKGLPAGRLQGT